MFSGPAGAPMSPEDSVVDGTEFYEPKIAETQSKSRSAFSVTGFHWFISFV